MITVQRIRPSGTLWTLADTATELLLLPNEAGTITTISGAVSQIRDFKGNGRNFDGAAGSRPTITPNALNGKASITFNGSQWLTFAGLASVFNMLHTAAGAGATIVAVWKAGNNSNPNTRYALLGNNAVSSGNHGFSLTFDDRASVSRNERAVALIGRGVPDLPAVANSSADLAHPPNAPVIITHIGDTGNTTAASRSILRINGASINGNTETGAASSANAAFTLQLGAGGNNFFPLVGEIYMIGILPPGTSLATVERAEGYAAGPVAGWNLQSSLVAGHPWKSAAPTV